MLDSRSGLFGGVRFSVGVKEGAARAVLRDAWQHGHESIELRRDGRRLIFFCTLCSTRCYSDAALSDHLNGNQHSRRALAQSSSPPCSSVLEYSQSSDPQTVHKSGNFGETEQSVNGMNGKAKNDSRALSVLSDLNCNSVGAFPASSLEWIGSAEILLKAAQSEPSRQVKAVWCRWLGRKYEEESDVQARELVESSGYSVVIFPYSDAIGRRGNWKPACMLDDSSSLSREKPQQLEYWRKRTKNLELRNRESFDPLAKDCLSSRLCLDSPKKEGEPIPKDLSQRALRKALKKQKLDAMERLCFICHQQMLPGKDVAALLNLKAGQMMCSSRNKRGAFHVFHTSCLVDWILLCETKFWIAPPVGSKGETRRMRGQVNAKQQKGGSKATAGSNGPMFCPECQGTGAKFHGHQLEQPRYRLAQVFEWVLELIQARKYWMEHSEQKMNSKGLLFVLDTDCGSNVLPLGFVQFYAAGSLEFLAGTALKGKTSFI